MIILRFMSYVPIRVIFPAATQNGEMFMYYSINLHCGDGAGGGGWGGDVLWDLHVLDKAVVL